MPRCVAIPEFIEGPDRPSVKTPTEPGRGSKTVRVLADRDEGVLRHSRSRDRLASRSIYRSSCRRSCSPPKRPNSGSRRRAVSHLGHDALEIVEPIGIDHHLIRSRRASSSASTEVTTPVSPIAPIVAQKSSGSSSGDTRSAPVGRHEAHGSYVVARTNRRGGGSFRACPPPPPRRS